MWNPCIICPFILFMRTRAHSQADRARYSLSVRPSGARTRSPQGRQLNGKLGIKWKKSKYKSEPLRTQWKPLSLSWPPNSPKRAPCRGLGGLRQGAKRVPGPGSEEPGHVAAGVAATSQTRNKVRDHQSAWPDLLRRKAAPHREVAGARRPSCPVPCSAGRAPSNQRLPRSFPPDSVRPPLDPSTAPRGHYIGFLGARGITAMTPSREPTRRFPLPLHPVHLRKRRPPRRLQRSPYSSPSPAGLPRRRNARPFRPGSAETTWTPPASNGSRGRPSALLQRPRPLLSTPGHPFPISRFSAHFEHLLAFPHSAQGLAPLCLLIYLLPNKTH